LCSIALLGMFCFSLFSFVHLLFLGVRLHDTTCCMQDGFCDPLCFVP
jgi:hypothetical protein